MSDTSQRNGGAGATGKRASGWAIGILALGTLAGIGKRKDNDGKSGAELSSAAAGGRGRSATTPSEIPACGWKQILYRTYEEFSNDRLMLVAAGLTFYVLLAIFPAVAALVFWRLV